MTNPKSLLVATQTNVHLSKWLIDLLVSVRAVKAIRKKGPEAQLVAEGQPALEPFYCVDRSLIENMVRSCEHPDFEQLIKMAQSGSHVRLEITGHESEDGTMKPCDILLDVGPIAFEVNVSKLRRAVRPFEAELLGGGGWWTLSNMGDAFLFTMVNGHLKMRLRPGAVAEGEFVELELNTSDSSEFAAKLGTLRDDPDAPNIDDNGNDCGDPRDAH